MSQTKLLPAYTNYWLIQQTVQQHPDAIAQLYRTVKTEPFHQKTFQEMAHDIRDISLGLLELGMQQADKIGLIADVGPNWLPVCWGICGIGGVDVPRGTDATVADLEYIFQHAECKIIFLENIQVFKKIEQKITNFTGLKTIIFFTDPGELNVNGIEMLSLAQLISKGQAVSDGDTKYHTLAKAVGEEDMATIIYTSGTTGSPKGVMHTQKSLSWAVTHQVKGITVPKDGVTMGFLPPWHIAERLIECVAWHTVTATAFTSVATLGKDLLEARPTFLLSVPRVWESLYNKVLDGVKKAAPTARAIFHFSRWAAIHWSLQKDILLGRKYQLESPNIIVTLAKKILALILLPFLLLPNLVAQLVLGKVRRALGGRVAFAISGAGALPEYIDRFFYAIGIPILETYGLTESVGVTCRRELPAVMVGTVGKPLKGTQIKLIDDAGHIITKSNTKGVAWHHGPHIMKGYYKNPQQTAEVIKDGWLNSGDILLYTSNGALKFAGRAKDTIVLNGGENIEPLPIEDVLSQSAFIQQVVVVGQDQKTLAALIVPAKEAILNHFKAQGIELTPDMSEWHTNTELIKLLKAEIKSRVCADTGFKGFERVTGFSLLAHEFEIGDELTQTMKVKRNVVFEKYAKEIAAMYK